MYITSMRVFVSCIFSGRQPHTFQVLSSSSSSRIGLFKGAGVEIDAEWAFLLLLHDWTFHKCSCGNDESKRGIRRFKDDGFNVFECFFLQPMWPTSDSFGFDSLPNSNHQTRRAPAIVTPVIPSNLKKHPCFLRIDEMKNLTTQVRDV